MLIYTFPYKQKHSFQRWHQDGKMNLNSPFTPHPQGPYCVVPYFLIVQYEDFLIALYFLFFIGLL